MFICQEIIIMIKSEWKNIAQNNIFSISFDFPTVKQTLKVTITDFLFLFGWIFVRDAFIFLFVLNFHFCIFDTAFWLPKKFFSWVWTYFSADENWRSIKKYGGVTQKEYKLCHSRNPCKFQSGRKQLTKGWVSWRFS